MMLPTIKHLDRCLNWLKATDIFAPYFGYRLSVLSVVGDFRVCISNVVLCLVGLQLAKSIWQFQRVTHYNDVIMGAIASQITCFAIVYSTVYSGSDRRKHQSSASLAFVGPVNSPHKWPVTRKMFQSDDVIMIMTSIPIVVIIVGFV